jgi:hypothetical protein
MQKGSNSLPQSLRLVFQPPDNNIFLSQQISISYLISASKWYFSRAANQHQTPINCKLVDQTRIYGKNGYGGAATNCVKGGMDKVGKRCSFDFGSRYATVVTL